MIRTYPKPDPIQPPLYLSSELWLAFVMIFGALLGMSLGGFYFVDGGKLNDCTNLKAPQIWIDDCNQLNSMMINLFLTLGSIVGISLVMFFISKRQFPNEVKQE